MEDSSNEITAIPSLTDELDITDAVVSINAIGCRRETATQITTKDGHYLPALKENQKGLYEDALFGFKTCPIEVEWIKNPDTCRIKPSNQRQADTGNPLLYQR